MEEESAQPTFVTCDECGCQSTLTQLFVRKGPRRFCPRCAHLRFQQQQGRSCLFILSVGPLVTAAALVLMVAGDVAYGGLFINLITLLLAIYGLIPFHELAHALMAKLLGGRIFMLHIGIGKLLLRRWLGGVQLSLSRIPVIGVCVSGFPTARAIKVRQFLVTAAGPLFHGVFILLLWPTADWARLAQGWAWREMLILANALLLFSNLFVFHSVGGALQVPSDGLQMIALLRNQLDAATLHAAYFAHEAARLWLTKQLDAAFAVCRAGLERYPQNQLLQNMYGYLLIKQERIHEAFCFYAAAVAVAPNPKQISEVMVHALNCNNAAWALLHDPEQGSDFLEKARGYDQEAYTKVPWLHSVQGTHGALLIAQGQLQSGLDHLHRAEAMVQTSGDPRERENLAAIWAGLAIGYQRLGQTTAAHEYLARAQAMDANDLVTRRARAEVAAGGQAANNAAAAAV